MAAAGGTTRTAPASPSGAVRLRFGRAEVEVHPGPGRFLGRLAPRHVPGLADPESAVLGSLRAPIGSAPLRDLARGGRTAAILISCRTRTTRSDVFVKVIADELNAAGIPDEGITVYLATGTHVKQDAEDMRVLLGQEAFARLRWVAHDPKDRGNLVSLGVTSLGTPIWVNRAVYESDVKVLTGRVTHHYFAGFSGGRKAIAPGVSGLETILANHRRVMRREGGGRDPAVYAGSLERNPIHLDMLEVAHAAAPSFCLNTVLNADEQITHVFGGHFVQAHLAGCAVVESLFRCPVPERADLVLASCGGWPGDISFMQAVKTIVSAERAVRDGGVLVVFAQCERGLEPGFREWFAHPSLQELNRAVLAHYNLKGHNSYWVREIQQRIRIVLVSSLPDADACALGMVPAGGPEDAVRMAGALVGGAPSILAVPHGNVTVFS